MSKTESGEFVMAGAGDLHIEICISQLMKMSGLDDIIVSEPTVSYRETVLGSCEAEFTKSTNKLNRLYTECSPIEEDISVEVEDKDLSTKKKDEVLRILRDEYEWEPEDIKKIWSWGLDDYLANCIIDKTIGMQYMKEVKQSLIDGFYEVLRQGPLCGEKLRGVQFRVTDAKFHGDPMHRGVGQVTPMCVRGCKAAFLASQPRLQEPIFLCTISTEESKRGDVYSCLGNRRGKVISDEYISGEMITIKAYLPVSESFGFTTFLRESTGGKA